MSKQRNQPLNWHEILAENAEAAKGMFNTDRKELLKPDDFVGNVG